MGMYVKPVVGLSPNTTINTLNDLSTRVSTRRDDRIGRELKKIQKIKEKSTLRGDKGPIVSWMSIDNDISLDVLMSATQKTSFRDSVPYYRVDDSYMNMTLLKFRAIKKTPKGMWVVRDQNSWTEGVSSPVAHFILNGQGKRFAYPSVEGAVGSYLRRKRTEMLHIDNKIVEFWEKSKKNFEYLKKRREFIAASDVMMIKYGGYISENEKFPKEYKEELKKHVESIKINGIPDEVTKLIEDAEEFLYYEHS